MKVFFMTFSQGTQRSDFRGWLLPFARSSRWPHRRSRP